MFEVDNIALNFNPESLLILNIILGVVMFGIALDMKLGDFRVIFQVPRSMLIGLTCQFLLLPFLTYLLVLIIRPLPSIALGMLLVAACPGGNISNFFTHIAGGNTALSITMSAVSTAAAVIMTPLNLAVWGGLYPPTARILTDISLSPLDLAVTIFLLLGLPLAAGLTISHRFPAFAARAKGPLRIFSMAFFGLFVLGALAANFNNFLNYVGLVVVAVFIHNALAIGSGYWGARLSGLNERDRRAVAIEVGIQNSGLGLVIIFNFFDGLGGMAVVTAWWGIWHIIAGMTLAWFWGGRFAAIKVEN